MIVCIIALDYYQGYNNWKWEFQLSVNIIREMNINTEF